MVPTIGRSFSSIEKSRATSVMASTPLQPASRASPTRVSKLGRSSGLISSGQGRKIISPRSASCKSCNSFSDRLLTRMSVTKGLSKSDAGRSGKTPSLIYADADMAKMKKQSRINRNLKKNEKYLCIVPSLNLWIAIYTMDQSLES